MWALTSIVMIALVRGQHPVADLPEMCSHEEEFVVCRCDANADLFDVMSVSGWLGDGTTLAVSNCSFVVFAALERPVSLLRLEVMHSVMVTLKPGSLANLRELHVRDVASLDLEAATLSLVKGLAFVTIEQTTVLGIAEASLVPPVAILISESKIESVRSLAGTVESITFSRTQFLSLAEDSVQLDVKTAARVDQCVFVNLLPAHSFRLRAREIYFKRSTFLDQDSPVSRSFNLGQMIAADMHAVKQFNFTGNIVQCNCNEQTFATVAAGSPSNEVAVRSFNSNLDLNFCNSTCHFSLMDYKNHLRYNRVNLCPSRDARIGQSMCSLNDLTQSKSAISLPAARVSVVIALVFSLLN